MLKIAEKHVFQQFFLLKKNTAGHQPIPQIILIPDINSSNGRDRMAAERLALNSPLQGSAADLIKLAMIAVHRRMSQGDLPGKVLLQVHDELLLEVPETHVEAVSQMLKEEMEGAAELKVPLKVDVGLGHTWAEAH